MIKRIFVAICLGLLISAQSTLGAAKDDTSQAVHPGQPGVRPFWNVHAQRFIYAPAFDAPTVDGATSYRFTVKPSAGESQAFMAATPYAALSPVWETVPEGFTTVAIQGVSADGKEVGKAFEKSFYRSPGFSGTAAAPLKPYEEAGRWALKAIFDAPHVQAWLKSGKPDPAYERYCYPNKVVGGLLRAMCEYAKVAESEKDRAAAKQIALHAGDYLLSLRYPEPNYFAGVAPTYWMKDVTKATGVTPARVQDKWLFVPSTVDAALALLDLYDLTKDSKYMDGAKGIADTLVKRQEPDGTWPNMINYETGKPIAPQRMIPTWVIFLFDRFNRQYQLDQYQPSREKAWNWIVGHPLKTYQWDAQFEDIKLNPPYVDLAREQACDVAVLLLSNPKHSTDDIAQAEELIRFAEDQFAIWAPVKDVDGWHKAMPKRNKTAADWITPGIFEQYVCYAPVARSAAILINTYLKAHEVTNNPQYLEKAKALANGMIEGQDYFAKNFNTNGEIPTWGIKKSPVNWLNNSFYAAQAVLNVANHTAATQPSVK